MSTLSLFRRTRGDARTLSPIATDETFESRFWTTMVIIALFFFYLLPHGDEVQVSSRA